MQKLEAIDLEALQPERAVSATALSGKGGSGKSAAQYHVAGEASSVGISSLLMDCDPEMNLTQRFNENQPGLTSAPGLGDVLLAAGIMNGDDDFDIAAGAAKLLECIQPLYWEGVDILPAGKSLQKISQLTLAGTEWMWLLRNIFEAAGLFEKYGLLLPDTAGRRGSLVTMVMYASDVAYSPIHANGDAVLKAQQARARVFAIQQAHPLVWGGVVLSGFDSKPSVNGVIRDDIAALFGAEFDKNGRITTPGEIIADIPYRPASIHQTYTLGDRLADLKKQQPQVIEVRNLVRQIIRRILVAATEGSVHSV